MLNSCNCTGTLLDPATISKCSICGCVHYHRPKNVCQKSINVRQSWVDECTIPKRKDVVTFSRNGETGRSSARKFDSQVCGSLKRVSRLQSPAVGRKRRSSEKQASSSRSPPPIKPASAPPSPSVSPPIIPTAAISPEAASAALSPALTADISPAPIASIQQASTADQSQALTAAIPEASTAAVPVDIAQASTATIPQASTAAVPQASTVDIPQASTAAIPQASIAAIPQATTADITQASTAGLSPAPIPSIQQATPQASTSAIPPVSTAPITASSSSEQATPSDLADPGKIAKRASFLLPGATEAIHANGDKVQNGKTAQNLLSQPQVTGSTSVTATVRPTVSQSEHTISKSFCTNDKISDKFSCFLKKVKSTELFIRNLFNEVNTNTKPPCIDKWPSCRICINNNQSNTFCGTVGDSCATPQNNQQCDSDPRICSNQSLDLIELKNTVHSLKDMMCKQSQNGSPNNDAILQRVLGELKKHVNPDEIEKLLKAPPSTDNTIAVMEDSMAPFVFFKCRPFCDQHGVFIVEWKVTSFLGIGGYEIYVDGAMKQNIPSAIRNTALIPGINSKCEHLMTISAIPLPDCNLNSNDKWTPASCRYKPGCSR